MKEVKKNNIKRVKYYIVEVKNNNNKKTKIT